MVDILKLRKMEKEKKEEKKKEEIEKPEYEVVDEEEIVKVDSVNNEENETNEDKAEALRQKLLEELMNESNDEVVKVEPEEKNNPKDTVTEDNLKEEPKPAVKSEEKIEGNGTLDYLQQEEEKKSNINYLQLIGFNIGSEYYGIEVKDIKEIIKIVDITYVPKVEKFIAGVINLRGNVVPVVSLRKKFGMEAIDYDKDTRIIVIEREDLTVGFIVDKIKEVIRIDETRFEFPPEIAVNEESKYIKSIAKTDDGVITLLDVNFLLEHKRTDE